MRPACFLLLLVAIHQSVPVDCNPGLPDPEQLQHQLSSSGTAARPGRSTGTGRFYLEMSGPVRKGINRDFLVILPVRRETSNFVSIFDLRRKRFLCMDLEGELYNSREKDREECLFQRIWLDLENHQDVFYSASGGRLLRLEEAEMHTAHQKSPNPSSALLEKFLGPLVKRQRRSERMNPSDPLRSESHPTNPAKDHQDPEHGQPEQDQAGAVSKETITSCDDPLRVLHSSGPVSPVKTNIADRAEQD
uniref:fibroblast growth factor 23-like n=1 Tax=Centroberyx gerrardi TaxID=166262 RepID=UPI003AAA56BE